MKSTSMRQSNSAKTTNSKPIPHIPLPFNEVIADVLKVKPPERPQAKKTKRQR